MTIDQAVAVAGWRYSGDCTGVEARVAGLTEDPGIVDVGVGMHPELVGRGNGARFGEIVLHYLEAHHPGITLRAVVQSWNERSLTLTHRPGFQTVGKLVVVQDGRKVTFDVLHRSPTPTRA